MSVILAFSSFGKLKTHRFNLLQPHFVRHPLAGCPCETSILGKKNLREALQGKRRLSKTYSILPVGLQLTLTASQPSSPNSFNAGINFLLPPVRAIFWII